MTFVDDSLTGAVTAKGSKAGAKGAKQADITAQKDAFNRAFSEAGKKQQPQISIREKSNADASETQSRISIQNANTTVSNTVAGEEDALSTVAIQDEASLIETLQNAPDLPADAGPKIEEQQPANETHARSKLNQARADALFAKIGDQTAAVQQTAETDEQSTETSKVDTDVTRKLAELFKERQSQVTKLQSDGKAAAKDAGDTAAVEMGKNATTDVDQLLALLGSGQAKADTVTAAATSSSALNEFQALADRAGKAKPAAKDQDASAKAGQAVAAHNAETNAAANAEAAEKDQLFRFARADGKGQNVSMAIRSDGEKATVDTNATGAQSAKAENVTVLEARRYLGVAPVSSNAQALTSAIASNPEWTQSVQTTSATGDSVQQQVAGKVVNTLKIQMHPIDLGMVTATLRLRDDELHVDLKVETGDAFRQLSDDQNAMVKALRAQGFAVDQVNVVFNAPDSNSGNSQSQQQQPQTGGQTGREASAGGGTAQGREQRNDSGNQQSQGERWTTHETAGDLSSGTGSAGDVYI